MRLKRQLSKRGVINQVWTMPTVLLKLSSRARRLQYIAVIACVTDSYEFLLPGPRASAARMPFKERLATMDIPATAAIVKKGNTSGVRAAIGA